jgi:hypothetical protein
MEIETPTYDPIPEVKVLNTRRPLQRLNVNVSSSPSPAKKSLVSSSISGSSPANIFSFYRSLSYVFRLKLLYSPCDRSVEYFENIFIQICILDWQVDYVYN